MNYVEFQAIIAELQSHLRIFSCLNPVNLKGVKNFWKYSIMKATQFYKTAKTGDILLISKNYQKNKIKRKFSVGILLRMPTYELYMVTVRKKKDNP